MTDQASAGYSAGHSAESLGLRILATAEALPRRVVPTAEVAARCGLDPQLAEARSGVRERRWLSEGETALSLGAEAARCALDAASLEVGQVDVLLNASGSQLQPIPDGAALLARELGLRGAAAYSLHGTCLSFLLALHHAALLLHAGQAQHILIVSSEAGSLGLNFAQPESALLIGDGAAAVLVGRAEGGEGVQAMRFETYPEGADHTRIRGGGSLLPPGHPDAGPLDFTFDMQGRRVLRLAAQVVPGFLERLRPGLSTGLPGIDRVVPHQASAAGLELMRRSGWPPEQTETTLATLGNVVAASLPLTLHRALSRPAEVAPAPQILLLVGTGAGLSVGGLILRV
ncbi:3-oxoacyl-ACP synthase III family protein [Deinococcus sp. Leaf326]|uniref:3-oxoacyl-ACP synthase III family protein n=1 Tax=Deinococcus sp. Leaf326 TaxID=1736338 RepID=UPI0006F37C2C|nr:3-oxoacyl-[acyl-carrier-protein] synthase III C-terminal domain-containing protein [Deinococcus sp. Leaf326]KQR25557.1 beta-ketoacyl-ACP reductase [Deinococcus sp. Leaf326]